MAPYPRPENTLRRVDELLSVNQRHAALATMAETIGNKRARSTPVNILEPIMVRFIELAIELGRSSVLKECLHAYKNTFQNSQPASVDKVIHCYVGKAKEKLEAALQEISLPDKASSARPDDVEDLEAPDTPDSLSFAALVDDDENSSTTTSPTKETTTTSPATGAPTTRSSARFARSALAPALRLLWSAYRTCLEVVRNNNKLEHLYHQLASDLFAFCVAHRRRTELRRACDTLRQHLSLAQKPSSSNHIDLNKSETLQPHIETRFLQLNATIELELWQEALRTAEDINSLFSLSRKSLKSSTMTTYYEKLVAIFAVGDNPLYRAAAYTKLLAFAPDQASTLASAGNKDKEKEKTTSTSNLADHVLLSLLAVPVSADSQRKFDDSTQAPFSVDAKAKASTGSSRLSLMLNLSREPTRQSLLRDALARNVLKRASADVKELYTFLEVDFHPLSITSKIEPIFARLAQDPSLQSYLDPLREVVLARLFQQLAQVYDVLNLERAVSFAEGKQGTFSRTKSIQKDEAADASPQNLRNDARIRVERFIADACRRRQLDVSIDHAQSSLTFTRSAPNSSAEDVFTEALEIGDMACMDNLAASASTSSQLPAPDILQPPATALMRTQLSRLANSMAVALSALDPEKESQKAKKEARRAAALSHLAESLESEREALLRRRQIIDHRINHAREVAARKEGNEAHARQLLHNQRLEEERKRLKDVQEQRAQATFEEEKKKARLADNERLLSELRERGRLDIDEKVNLADLDRNELLQMSVEAIAKEKRDLNAKLSVVGKKVDHLERAQRLEEIPLLKIDYERQVVKDSEQHEADWINKLNDLKAEYERKIEAKKRMVNISGEYKAYVSKMAGERDKVNAERRKQAEENITHEKEQYTANLRAKKQVARDEAERIRREKAEEERIRREEREREEAEEQERITREAEVMAAADAERKAKENEKAQREAQYAESRAKLDEQARKQREREEEAERRLQERKRGIASGGPPPPARNTAAPPSSNIYVAKISDEERKKREEQRAQLDEQARRQRERDEEIERKRAMRSVSAAVPSTTTNSDNIWRRSSAATPKEGIWRPRTNPAEATRMSGGAQSSRPPPKLSRSDATSGSGQPRNETSGDDDGFQTVKRRDPGSRAPSSQYRR